MGAAAEGACQGDRCGGAAFGVDGVVRVEPAGRVSRAEEGPSTGLVRDSKLSPSQGATNESDTFVG